VKVDLAAIPLRSVGHGSNPIIAVERWKVLQQSIVLDRLKTFEKGSSSAYQKELGSCGH
jgi:hypothetical protein